MKRLVISILALILAGCGPSPSADKILAPVAPVSLTSVTAKIHTTSDDKDNDTKLDIALTGPDDKPVAEAKNVFGAYEDNSDHSVPLEKKADVGKADLANSRLNIHIAPNGEDQWDFNLTLEFKFSDGTVILSKPLNGNVMTEKNPDLSLLVSLPGK